MQGVASQRAVTIDTESGRLQGRLATTGRDHGLVVSVLSEARSDRFDAVLRRALNDDGLATLVLELLTSDERQDPRVTRCRRTDISTLAGRLAAATDWAEAAPEIEGLPIGYFGARMASAAVLTAAARRPASVAAVVLCDGRPLLAAPALPQVRAPTLSIVSSAHDALVRLNRAGLARLLCEKRFECVPGALQLVDDASMHEPVSLLARDWFERHFRRLQS